ncbi:MAG: T9SS type A sorting domain-containing protein [Chitinophagales bacterium]|nr:T9SS type A sorting domain-containing protein [Chitinophagales bacterium]
MSRLFTIIITFCLLSDGISLSGQSSWSYFDDVQDYRQVANFDVKQLSNGHYISVGGGIEFDEESYDIKKTLAHMVLLSTDGQLIQRNSIFEDEGVIMLYAQDIPKEKVFFVISHSYKDNFWYSSRFDYDLNLISNEIIGGGLGLFIDEISYKYNKLASGNSVLSMKLEGEYGREVGALVVFDDTGKIISHHEFEDLYIYSLVDRIDASGYVLFAYDEVVLLDVYFEIEDVRPLDLYKIGGYINSEINAYKWNDQYIAPLFKYDEDTEEYQWELAVMNQDFEIDRTILLGTSKYFEEFFNNSMQIDDYGNILLAAHEYTDNYEVLLSLRVFDKDLNIISSRSYASLDQDDDVISTNFIIGHQGDWVVSGLKFLENDNYTVSFVWSFPGAFINSVANVTALPDFALFPNPTNTDIYLDLPESVRLERISVSDCQGKEVMAVIGQDMDKVLDVRHLLPGLYHLSLMHTDGKVQTKQFVKK